MLCLTLASCACDRVPAVFFTRPYNPLQRRWNSDGEIEKKRVPEAIALPQWPKRLFVETTENNLPPRERQTVYSETQGWLIVETTSC